MARRAGWVGCYIALNRVPAEARIAVVTTISSLPQSGAGVPAAPPSNSSEGRRDACATLSQGERVVIATPEEVREKFRRVKPLAEIKAKERGWTLDVLNVVAAVCDRRKSSGAHRAPLQSWKEFTTADAYTFTRELEKFHPEKLKHPSADDADCRR
jgi:hypothetical protein